MKNWLNVFVFVCAALLGGASSRAGELFATFDLLPSEAAAFFESILNQGEAAQRSIAALNQLEILFSFQELASGDCDAFPTMEALASGGDAKNQYFVGAAFLNGWCVSIDFDRALAWFKQSANNGFDQAAVDYATGVYDKLEQGEPISREYQSTAIDLLKAAAKNLHPDANFNLGYLYKEGKLVPKDIAQAEKLFIEAAAGNNENAVYNLGLIYIEQNKIDLALDWFRFGATKGLAVNQVMAAALLSDLERPDGYVEGYKWVNIASATAQRDQIVQAALQIRSNLETKMTREQISDAQALSSAFEPNLYIEPPHAPKREEDHQYSYDELVDPTSTPEEIAARKELEAMGVQINRLAFFNAIQEDNIDLVKLFIRAGASLEAIAIGAGDGPKGATPLYVAVDWRAAQTYRYLMQQDVNLDAAANETGYTPLVRALAHERYDWAEELLDAGADATMQGNADLGLITQSALGFAAGSDNAELVRRILAQGGSVEERYSGGTTPLQMAITYGESAEVMELLLKEGADPNAIGNFETMLDATFDFEAQMVKTEAMALLLKYGADPETSERFGGNLLISAAAFGNPSAIRMLVGAGANPNKTVDMSDGEIPMLYDDPIDREILSSEISPLAVAAMMGNIGAAVTLIELGADTQFIVESQTGNYSVADLAERAGVTIPEL